MSGAVRGVKMSQRLVAVFVYLLLVPFFAHAQEKAAKRPPTAAATQQFSPRAASFSGMVSDDGSFFVADPDAVVWRVTNPEALRSYAGHPVKLQAQTSAATEEFRVLWVKPREAELKPVARLGDAAFRR